MKKKSIFLMMALLVVAAAALMGCRKTYTILLSSQDLYFGLEAETQTITIHTNCKWSISQHEYADWYTVSPMSGNENDTIITVTVKPMTGQDYRGSAFYVDTPGGHIFRTVFVSQNKLDFSGLVNRVFGVSFVEHWILDYYDQIIEDEYKSASYDPYDTTTGYLFYFMENGKGIQRDHHNDTAVYYAFDYEFVPDSMILHIRFETVDGAPENYAPNVLTASDSLFRFKHEYKPKRWERVDMRRVGTITPAERANLMRRGFARRKEGDPILLF